MVDYVSCVYCDKLLNRFELDLIVLGVVVKLDAVGLKVRWLVLQSLHINIIPNPQKILTQYLLRCISFN